MTWTPTQQEIRAVVRLPAQKRYEYFVTRVADTEMVWGAQRDGRWIVLCGAEGDVVPVWPHSQYVTFDLAWTQQGYDLRPVELDIWLAEELPEMERLRQRIAVFPTAESRGAIVEGAKLKTDLEQELEQY